MAFFLKKEYKLPFDICRYINNINDIKVIEKTNKNKLALHMELIHYIDESETYNIHEYYFVQILTFLKKNKILRPKYNKENDIYTISLKERNINYFHYILFKDHINIFLYQNKIYNIYYNLMI